MLGKPRALIQLFIFMAVLGVVLAIGSRMLDFVIGLLVIGFMIVGPVVALWRSHKARGNSEASTFPSQVSVLPRKWHLACVASTLDACKHIALGGLALIKQVANDFQRLHRQRHDVGRNVAGSQAPFAHSKLQLLHGNGRNDP